MSFINSRFDNTGGSGHRNTARTRILVLCQSRGLSHRIVHVLEAEPDVSVTSRSSTLAARIHDLADFDFCVFETDPQSPRDLAALSGLDIAERDTTRFLALVPDLPSPDDIRVWRQVGVDEVLPISALISGGETDGEGQGTRAPMAAPARPAVSVTPAPPKAAAGGLDALGEDQQAPAAQFIRHATLANRAAPAARTAQPSPMADPAAGEADDIWQDEDVPALRIVRRAAADTATGQHRDAAPQPTTARTAEPRAVPPAMPAPQAGEPTPEPLLRARTPIANGPAPDRAAAPVGDDTPQYAPAAGATPAAPAAPQQPKPEMAAPFLTDAGSDGATGRIVAVMRARGGAGASTLAVNLAAQLAVPAKGATVAPRVALIDLDIQNGNVGSFCDVPDCTAFADLIRTQSHPDGEFLDRAMVDHSGGFAILPAPDVFAPLTALSPDTVSALLDELRTRYDQIIIDLPQAIMDWMEPVMARASRALVVTDTSVPSVRATKRLIDLITEDHMTLPIDIIVNREKRPFSPSAAHKEAVRVLGRQLSHWIPSDPRAARKSIDLGQPLLVSARRSGMCKAIKNLAGTLPRATARTKTDR
ncbi:AAA family ATPase [Sulfitobacter sabulilitoris]|uniref:AAA domain-containing protein n=1 Tax=Sulfitobacter sabulilitoris TaxID=2562655 RepID=A0A5S3PJP1_9RHOB|nr:AAA family ATPase [Sulfitobacter sabulilitoris]TMM54628.1 hypothetical protein FDT80_03295 [Sulfitobacter sabulilitoris]